MTRFRFDNTYARDLPGLYSVALAARAPKPRLLHLDHALADELVIDLEGLDPDTLARLFVGNEPPEGAQPIAQAYAGHQFGGYSPQLGDGRALLLGEVIDRHGRRRDIALKGSGRTPYSRGGDGKAAVGPMLREALVSEAMHALGIPTTRTLAVAATGEPVHRERVLPGAVLARVAASHLRVGTFQYAAAQPDRGLLRRVADYTIERHDPDLSGRPDRHFALLHAVIGRQATLIAQWMNVGFIHGVMNTDNMTISGETIDYGPCAFIEAYDPATVFSSIDHGGRYAYANQPQIALWNLTRLAETLLPLVADPNDEAAIGRAVEQATTILHSFPARYQAALREGQRRKLGLRPATTVDTSPSPAASDEADAALADDWLALLQRDRVDFTLAWRRLADAAAGDEAPLRALFADWQAPQTWLARWRERGAADDAASGVGDAGVAARARADRMRAANPLVIPRNHRVEEALDAAQDENDLGPFEQLLAAVRRPFDDTPSQARYAEPAPAEVTARYQTFCGT